MPPTDDVRVTPTVGVSLRTSRQTVEESAATPVYVQTSRTSSGKNTKVLFSTK